MAPRIASDKMRLLARANDYAVNGRCSAAQKPTSPLRNWKSPPDVIHLDIKDIRKHEKSPAAGRIRANTAHLGLRNIKTAPVLHPPNVGPH